MKAQEFYNQDVGTLRGQVRYIYGGYKGIIEPGIFFCWDDGYCRWQKNHHHYEYNVFAIAPEFVILEAGSKKIRVKSEDVDIVPVEKREEILMFISQNLSVSSPISDDDMRRLLAEKGPISLQSQKTVYYVNRPPVRWGCGTYRKENEEWVRIANDYDSSD